jgi:hypothetical protein
VTASNCSLPARSCVHGRGSEIEMGTTAAAHRRAWDWYVGIWKYMLLCMPSGFHLISSFYPEFYPGL